MNGVDQEVVDHAMQMILLEAALAAVSDPQRVPGVTYCIDWYASLFGDLTLNQQGGIAYRMTTNCGWTY